MAHAPVALIWRFPMRARHRLFSCAASFGSKNVYWNCGTEGSHAVRLHKITLKVRQKQPQFVLNGARPGGPDLALNHVCAQ